MPAIPPTVPVNPLPWLASLFPNREAIHANLRLTLHRFRQRPATTLGHPILLTGLLISGLLWGVKQATWLEPLELFTYDQFINLQPPQDLDERLLMVGITDADINRQAQWPLSDQVLAQIFAELQRHRPRTIGLDLYRDIPHPPGTAALEAQLRAENVFGIEAHGHVPPPPALPPDRVGFNDVVTDPDGVVRRHLMFTALGEDEFYSFGLRLSLHYLAAEGISLQANLDALQIGDTRIPALQPHAGGYQGVDALGYQTLLRYRSRAAATRRVSLTELLAGQVPPSWIEDKIVLIGATASSTKDVFFTPHTKTNTQDAVTPGVEIHAQMVSQLLTAVSDPAAALYGVWPDPYEDLWMLGWAFIGGWIAWRIKRPLPLGLVGGGTLASLWGLHALFLLSGLWVPAIAPILSCAATGIGIVAYKRFHAIWHDPLTHLANRERFLIALRQTISRRRPKQGQHFAVLFLRLDRLNMIYASLGSSTGDQLLLSVVERWQGCLRRGEPIARISEAEFAILLQDISDIQQAIIVANRIQEQLELPFVVQGKSFYLTLKIGIALSQGEHIQHPQQLLQDAQAAMYSAKSRDQDHYAVFSEGMHEQTLHLVQLEAELRQALEEQAFYLNYQPIISLKSGKVTGFEALVRWQHPQWGFVSPGQFIPVAEETGLIIPLGEWVFREACAQLQAWHKCFGPDCSLIMSVNLSSKQLCDPRLVQQFTQILHETRVAGDHIKLEITESMMMNNLAAVQPILLKLKDLGVQLSIDDFGTGYSSLSYLPRLPVDNLKIDRSFVSRMHETTEDAEIVKMIVLLSQHLSLEVVAEGIEDEIQMRQLQGLGCEYGQGYFFSKPLSSDAAQTFLLNHQPQGFVPRLSPVASDG